VSQGGRGGGGRHETLCLHEDWRHELLSALVALTVTKLTGSVTFVLITQIGICQLGAMPFL
jgi:hypothetical protein